MPPIEPSDNSEQLRNEWLERLSILVGTLKGWSEEIGWSTRQISKRMKESRLGTYEAPALLMQKDVTRVLLDPVARFAPGTEGVVDLYLMPAYDDIASLYYVDGQWQLHYMFRGTPAVATVPEAEVMTLTRESFGQVLDEMTAHAASPF